MKKISILFVLLFAVLTARCQSPQRVDADAINPLTGQRYSLRLGAERLEILLPKLEGKAVGLVGNQTSRVGETHLVDTLLSLGVNLKRIFSPEHGFRGDVEAGAHIKDGKDERTGLPIISLYGRNRRPTTEHFASLDIVLFDLQDVGTRFYTYISTLHYVMETAAEENILVIVLDRPNPNGHFVDGPILEPRQRSFVGMHPIPIVHGMTIGEYAKMINGEGWLPNGMQSPLVVITMENYCRHLPYFLPVPPSPNLPTPRSIALYPSTCFFEGTNISLGRGTPTPFEIFGAPAFRGNPEFTFTFTPVRIPGKSENPPFNGQLCYGVDLTYLCVYEIRAERRINLSFVIKAFQNHPDQANFFLRNSFFDRLAGTSTLRHQIIAGMSEDEIRETWQPGLKKFLEMRRQYLLYDE